jgi:hypothetical protein
MLLAQKNSGIEKREKNHEEEINKHFSDALRV